MTSESTQAATSTLRPEARRIRARYFTDPGCPWGYSWRPSHARLLWRFGDQIDWRLAMIGLSEDASENEQKGFTPAKYTSSFRKFRERYGMPFSLAVKDRVAGTSRACRAIIAVRESSPELADAALKSIQLTQFTTDALIDTDADLVSALNEVDGIDAEAVVSRIDSPMIVELYESDRKAARSAESRPAESQGRHATGDGSSRYTAPTVLLEHLETGRCSEIGGFQCYESYDTAIANLDPGLVRREVPEDAYAVLTEFPHGLTTAEVASVLRPNELVADDLGSAERQLLELVGEGKIHGRSAGGDSLWWIPELAEGQGPTPHLDSLGDAAWAHGPANRGP